MQCDTSRDYIHRLLDHELSARKKNKLEEHLKLCGRCEREFRSLKSTAELLEELKFSSEGRFLSVLTPGLYEKTNIAPRASAAAWKWLAVGAGAVFLGAALYFTVPVKQLPPPVSVTDKGISYLIKTQNSDGSWGINNYRSSVAITSLALLSFLEQEPAIRPGHTFNKERSATVSRAVTFLLHSVQPSGLMCAPSENSIAMYAHSYGILALSRVYAATGRDDVRAALVKAIRLSESCQSKRGGWRYQPIRHDDDILITSSQLIALISAKEAGIVCSPRVIENALAYIKSCAGPQGGFSYTPETRADSTSPNFPMTIAGTSALVMADREHDTAARNGLECLANMTLDSQKSDPFFYYGLFFYSFCDAPSRNSQEQSRTMCAMLGKTQQQDGSWSDPMGNVFATAVTTLFLEKHGETTKINESRLGRDVALRRYKNTAYRTVRVLARAFHSTPNTAS